MTDIKFSKEDSKVFDLITKEYSEKELESISKLNYSINEYDKEYPIECLRKENNHYRLVYCGDSGYLIIYFDINGNKTFSNYYKKSIPKDEFTKIKQGTYYQDVMNLDKNGNYTSFYASSATEFFSEHYTIDGYYIIIEYDNNFNVVNMTIDYI